MIVISFIFLSLFLSLRVLVYYFIILTHRIHPHAHPINKMQSIAQQFSTTLRVNSSSSSAVSKKSFNKKFQVRAAVSMPSQDEDDGVVIASEDETFTPRAPATKQGNAVFS